jgi:hypothetical protein
MNAVDKWGMIIVGGLIAFLFIAGFISAFF